MRKHRGPAPEDARFFDAERVAILRTAVTDLSWLLTRRYSPKAAVELVGNRYQLTDRERLAVVHAAGDGTPRRAPESFGSLRGRTLCIDGFNFVITLETALGGGIILLGTDGCYRDIANVHGAYALREETEAAVAMVADALKEAQVADALWLLDRPVSNSGRLAALINRCAKERGAPMRAETAQQVDAKIRACHGVAVTADSQILAAASAWFDLAGRLIETRIPEACLVDLRCPDGPASAPRRDG